MTRSRTATAVVALAAVVSLGAGANSNTSLLDAVKRADRPAVRTLLKSGADERSDSGRVDRAPLGGAPRRS
jgi:hypothetical protein